MESTAHHSEYPLLSIVFGIITVYLRVMDLSALDKTTLEPLAHCATIAAGATTAILFLFAMRDRFIKFRNRKNKKP